jgi:hypothetical protein
MITKWRGQLLAKTVLAGFASMGVPAAMVAGTAILAPSAFAQETSITFDGRVVTESGAPVAGSTVTLTSDQGVTRSFTTDASGRISVPALAGGDYNVRISAPGYSTLVDNGVPVRTGSSSFTYTLTQSSSVETVVVTGQRVANLEFNNTATGIVVNTTELSSRVPLGRDIADIMLLAPGAVPGDETFSGAGSNYGNVTSISGASIAENAFYINGLNVTNHRTLIGGSRVPFEMYDTVEVRTGGYQAEYGRATGGVINATTKSGSNEFHYGYVGQFSPDFLQEDTRPNTYTARNEFDERDNWSQTFYASGPIIKDHLFFYGIYEAQSSEQTDTSETKSPALIAANRRPNMALRQSWVDESPTYGGKLDWVITDSHRIEYTYINDENETKVSKDRMSDTQQFIEHRGDFSFGGGGVSQIAKYTGDFTDWMTLAVSYGKNEQSDFIRAAPNPNLAMIDTTPGFTIETGRPWNALTLQEADDSREVWRADADFRFNLLGSHHVRVGYDDTTLETYQSTVRNGPCTPIVATPTPLAASTGMFNGQCVNAFLQRTSNLTSGAGGPYIGGRYRYDVYSNIGGFSSDQEAMYIQDSWDILPNLTLQLGVRADSYSNQNLEGETFVEIEDQVAPRVGFSWDPGDDGLSKLYGSFGTYYLPVATNTNVRLGGAEYFSRINYRALTGPAQYPAANYADYPTGLVYAGTTTFSQGIVPSLEQARTEDLQPFQEDEYVLGYERAFGDWTFGINYTHRELVEVIEDIAIDSAVVAYCEAQGGSCSSTFTGTHQYVLANPGKGVKVQLNTEILGDPAGTYRTLDLSAADLGYPEAERILDQVQLTAERKFDGKWGLQGSYTWMDSRGNYEGAVKSDNAQDDAGLTQDFDLPGLVVGAYGKLPNHREHTFRLFGTYAITEEFLIGANGYVQSPRQFGCLGVAPGNPNPTGAEAGNPAGDGGYAQLYGASAFYCLDRAPTNDGANAFKINSTPRGTQLESDWRTNLDLSFIWNKELPVTGTVQLRFDIFNVFNSDAVTDLNEVGDVANGALYLAGQAGPYASQSPTYGLPLNYQAPRRYQIGASFRF